MEKNIEIKKPIIFRDKEKKKTLDSSELIITTSPKNAREKEISKPELNENNSSLMTESLHFDMVSNFKNYHPENNVKTIIKKMVKMKENRKNLITSRRITSKNFKITSHKTEGHSGILRPSKINQIFPMNSSPLSSPLRRSEIKFQSHKTSTDQQQNKRPSSIFTSNLQNKNFFQHNGNVISFYDVVYEVLTNKELRKKLMFERVKSLKRKRTLKKK